MTFLSFVVELRNLQKTTVAAGMTRQIVTLEEVAQCLGLEEESLERFVATGQIPFTETPEGIRFDKDANDAFSYSLDCYSIEI